MDQKKPADWFGRRGERRTPDVEWRIWGDRERDGRTQAWWSTLRQSENLQEIEDMQQQQLWPSEQLARPTIGLPGVIAQAMAVRPIYSAAIFASFIAATAGTVGPFAALIATIGVLALGYVFATYARRFAGPGAVYEYVAQTLGRRAGVAIGQERDMAYQPVTPLSRRSVSRAARERLGLQVVPVTASGAITVHLSPGVSA